MIKKLFRRRGMSCDAVMEVLQSYLDGETDAETARLVAAHLHTCTDCDQETATFRRIKLSLASTPSPVDPAIISSLQHFSARLTRGELG